MTTEIETLEAKLTTNREAQKELRAKLDRLTEEGFAIERQLHRAKVAALIGQRVKVRYRRNGHPDLNDAVGTLTEVRRTRCTVDFGDLGRWTMPIDDVAEVGCEQGTEILF